jgi:hypothetical protein
MIDECFVHFKNDTHQAECTLEKVNVRRFSSEWNRHGRRSWPQLFRSNSALVARLLKRYSVVFLCLYARNAICLLQVIGGVENHAFRSRAFILSNFSTKNVDDISIHAYQSVHLYAYLISVGVPSVEWIWTLSRFHPDPPFSFRILIS